MRVYLRALLAVAAGVLEVVLVGVLPHAFLELDITPTTRPASTVQ